MHKRIKPLLLLLGILVGCSENVSSPQDSQEYSSVNDSTQIFFSSSSIRIEESSSSEKAIESSSSEKKDNKSSSSAKSEESSSSEKHVESSSSEKNENKSSSSAKSEESSSSEKHVESSSSEKNENKSSSSAKSEESSSSEKHVESSSSEKVVESSSSDSIAESSASEYYKLSWDYLNPSIPYDTIIDSRDGQVYKVVTVGSLIWMAENLNYYDTIQIPELTAHSWCFNNDVNYCERRGRLYDNPVALDYDSTQTTVYKRYQNEEGGYDSLSVVGICPGGWRIPTRTEWLQLNSSCSVRSEQWGGDNSCGVSINSTGYRYAYRDSTDFIAGAALYWTSSYNSASRPFMIRFERNKLGEYDIIWRSSGLSIRCVKDK